MLSEVITTFYDSLVYEVEVGVGTNSMFINFEILASISKMKRIK